MNERAIAPAFAVSTLCAIGLMVAYATGGIDRYDWGFMNFGEPQLEGVLLLGAFGGFGTALILWSKHLFPQDEVEQHRHVVESTPEERKEFDDLIGQGVGDVARRKFLSRFAGVSLGAIGLAAIFPLKSLGPNPGNSLFHTQWKAGIRLTREDGSLVRPSDLAVGGLVTAWPEGVEREENSAILLIRVPEEEFKPRSGRENWIVEGNVAYSKICTHVGCPVSLYRETTKDLLCPCHQSTFNVLDGARPIFGPATRSLPQLPLTLTSDGYLAAQSDFHEPVGPGFWNRGRKKVEA